MPVAGQRAPDIAGGAPIADPQRDVDPVGDQIDASIRDEHIEGHRRIPTTKGAEDLPESLEVGGHGDAKPTGHTRRVVNPLFSLREGGERRLGIRHELVPRWSERQASRTALEQTHTQVVFELAQLAAQRRQGDAGPPSRLRDPSRLGGPASPCRR